MHRSGTSTITGLLDILGLSAGKNLMPCNEFNAKGYFEPTAIVAIHDELLEALGSCWHDVRFLPEGWLASAAAQKAKAQLILLFKTEYAGQGIGVLKDPRICHLLPLWLDIFGELNIKPVFIFSRRYPDEVIASLAKRDTISENSSRLLYIRHLLDAELYSRGFTRVVVDFSTLLTDWSAVLKKIDANLALNIFPLSEEIIINIQDFLAPELKHFNFVPVQADSEDSIPEKMAINIYNLLGMIDSDGQAQKFDNLLTTFGTYIKSLEPWLSLSAQLNFPSNQEAIFQQLNAANLALQLATDKNAELIFELNTLKNQHRQLGDEITRAQGQLELLKDLMIENLGLEGL